MTVIPLIPLMKAFIGSRDLGRPAVSLLLRSELLDCGINLDHDTPNMLCNLAILIPLLHSHSIRYLLSLGLSGAHTLSDMSQSTRHP